MKEKLWSIPYVVMLIVGTADAMSFYMIISVLSKYLTDEGIGLSLAGFIVGMFSIVALVVRPFCGVMTDRLNKPRLLIAAFVLGAVCLFGYSITTNAAIIIVFRLLHGAVFSVSATVLYALVADCIPASRMSEGIGYVGIGAVIASAVGAGLGVELAEVIGYREVFWISAAFLLIGAVLVCSVYRKFVALGRPVRKAKEKTAIRWKDLIAMDVLGYSVVSAGCSFSGGVISAFLLLFAAERGIGDLAIYYTVTAVVMLLLRMVSGKLADRRGLAAAVYPGLVICAISMFVLSRATNMGILLVSAVLKSIGQGMAMPSLQAECVKVAGKARSGVATGTYYLGADVAQGLGPMLGGIIVAAAGYSFMFIFCGVIILAMIGVFFLTEKRRSAKK